MDLPNIHLSPSCTLIAMTSRKSFLGAVYWQVQPEGNENKCREFAVNTLMGGYAAASGDATVCCASQ